jgi:hypothetical protein
MIGQITRLQAHQGAGPFKGLLSDLMHHKTEAHCVLAAQMKKFLLITLATCIVFDLIVMWIMW